MYILKAIFIVITVLSFNSNASLINLDFSNHLEVNDTSADFSLGPAYTGNTMHFLNVGTEDGVTADARVTATPFGIYSFEYHIPNYNQTSGAEPNGDIGFIMTSNEVGTGGLTYLFELFDGTGSNSNTFTTPLEAELLSIMIYDVDGESSQSETFRAYYSDGLFSYQTGTHASSLVATSAGPGEILFTGPGTNYSEQSTVGAAILNFRNTSSFTLNFESETYTSSGENPVFSAIDGNLSMESDDFEPPVSVHEPKFMFIFMIVAIFLLRMQLIKQSDK
ncbi:hypothetical protein AADZ84_06035 [Colwelliaceae bacterium MEBiC 14330]